MKYDLPAEEHQPGLLPDALWLLVLQGMVWYKVWPTYRGTEAWVATQHRIAVSLLQGMVWHEVWPTCRGTPTWAATWRRMAVVMAVVAYRWLALNFTTTPCTHKDLNIWWLDNGTRYQSLWRCISHCEGASVTVMAYQSLWRCTVIVKVYQSLCRCTSYCEGVPITVIVKVYQSLWKCTSHCEGVPVTVKVYWSLWKCNH